MRVNGFHGFHGPEGSQGGRARTAQAPRVLWRRRPSRLLERDFSPVVGISVNPYGASAAAWHSAVNTRR